MPKALVPSGMLPLAVSEGATTPVPSYTSVAWSTVLGAPVYWDGARWTAGAGGRQHTSAGLRFLAIGASTEARANPVWSGTPANYVRSAGVVTLTVSYSNSDFPMLPGTQVRVACLKEPEVEGTFDVVTCTVSAGVSMTVSFADARPDIASGALAGGFDLHFPGGYTVSSGWPMHMNLCLGGRLDITSMAVGGANLVEDFGEARLEAIAAAGYHDIILIGTGVLGNTLRAFGAGPNTAFNALCALIEGLRDKANPRLVLVETPSASTDIYANTETEGPIFTSAQLLLRRMWQELPERYPFVRVVPCLEAMIQNYSAYNVAPSTAVLNAHPETEALSSDGIHPAYPWSALRGEVLANTMAQFAAPHISPEMGALPDTILSATRASPEGTKVRNYAKGLWGNVAATQVTISGGGCSGVAPEGASMSFTAGRGGSTAVSLLGTDARGGAYWRTTINGAGSSAGFTFQQNLSPSWLLDALNAPEVQGNSVDLFLPMLFQCRELKLIHVEVFLAATAGGTEYILGGPMLNRGQFGQAAIGRGMDAGFSGVLRAPRFKVPPATYTAAALRVIVKEVNGNVASGRTVIQWGAGQRLQLV